MHGRSMENGQFRPQTQSKALNQLLWNLSQMIISGRRSQAPNLAQISPRGASSTGGFVHGGLIRPRGANSSTGRLLDKYVKCNFLWLLYTQEKIVITRHSGARHSWQRVRICVQQKLNFAYFGKKNTKTYNNLKNCICFDLPPHGLRTQSHPSSHPVSPEEMKFSIGIPYPF